MEPRETPTFETQNVDLAAFLILQKIKFLGCRRSSENSRVVIMSFVDERQNCLDLERVFLNSECKRYRDINKWLLSKVHAELKK